MKILVTGGAGFIGCNFARLLVNEGHDVIVLDKLTYAGKKKNISDIINKIKFLKTDMTKPVLERAIRNINLDIIVNFAAETHVDRSIENPKPFLETNIYGTFQLLEAARKVDIEKFIHISTDEVYGSNENGLSKEKSQLNPRNPYSATKAAAEEGIVPGGGVALLRCIPALEKLNFKGDFQVGVNLVKRALEEPIRQIVNNAGWEGSVVVEKVKNEKTNVGFNAATEEYEDLVKAGIIDPTKVTRYALQNAASIASLLLTTEAMVTDIPEKKKPAAPMSPGGGEMY